MEKNENYQYSNSIYEMRMNEFCISHFNVPLIVNDESLKRPKCSVSPIDQSSLAYDESYIISSQNTTNNLSIQSPHNNNNLSKSGLPNVSSNPILETILQENNNTFNSSSAFSTSSPYYTQRINANLAKSQSLAKNLFVKNLNESKSIQYQSTPNKPQPYLTVPATTHSSSHLQQTSRVNFHSIIDLAKSDDQKSNDSFTSSKSAISFSSESANSSGYASSSTLNEFNEHLKNYMSSCNNKENSKMEFISKTKRKPRTQINRQQREILEYAYNLKGYPDSNEIEYLCNILGFEENVIRIWFQNKRARDKLRH